MRDRAVNRFGNVEWRHPIGPSNGAVESAKCVRHVVARQLTVARAKFFRRLRHPQVVKTVPAESVWSLPHRGGVCASGLGR